MQFQPFPFRQPLGDEMAHPEHDRKDDAISKRRLQLDLVKRWDPPTLVDAQAAFDHLSVVERNGGQAPGGEQDTERGDDPEDKRHVDDRHVKPGCS